MHAKIVVCNYVDYEVMPLLHTIWLQDWLKRSDMTMQCFGEMTVEVEFPDADHPKIRALVDYCAARWQRSCILSFYEIGTRRDLERLTFEEQSTADRVDKEQIQSANKQYGDRFRINT